MNKKANKQVSKFFERLKKMKNWIVAFSVFVICVSASGFVYTRLLSEVDLEHQRKDNENGVALGSLLKSEHQWGSYNQWQCFDLALVEFDCAEYDSNTLVPSVSVVTENEIILFDTYVEDRLDCARTLSEWRNLTSGGKEICIFAANMPDVDWAEGQAKPHSLWYIRKIKGIGGYWNLYDSSPAYNDNSNVKAAK